MTKLVSFAFALIFSAVPVLAQEASRSGLATGSRQSTQQAKRGDITGTTVNASNRSSDAKQSNGKSATKNKKHKNSKESSSASSSGEASYNRPYSPSGK